MKTALLDSLSARCQLDEAPEYTIATLLDPRYKTCFYSAVVSEAVIGQIKSKLAANQIQSTANNAPETAEDEPARKKPRIADSLFDCVDELLECANNTNESQSATATTCDGPDGNNELNQYLAEPVSQCRSM